MCFDLVNATKKDSAYLLKLRKLTMTGHLEKSRQFLSDKEHYIRIDDAYGSCRMVFYHDQLIGGEQFEYHMQAH